MKRRTFVSGSLLVAVELLRTRGVALAAETTPGPVATPQSSVDRADYARRVEAELRENILPFWLKRARDPERGGFYGEISDDLVVKADAPRGALLTARILWTFSAAYRRYHEPAYLEMARWAYADLNERFRDNDQGGLFWMVSADRKPIDTRKILYVQSFGIYALSEYAQATGEQAPLDRAIALYRRIEERARDRTHGGYYEEFTRDWKLWRGRGGASAMGALDQKSQNAHLHLLEAYTNLLRAWPDAALRQNLRELVDVMRTKILDEKTHHLGLFFSEEWKRKSDVISFGHDIEFAWLLTEAAELLGDSTLIASSRAEAVEIARATLARGVDRDGGVFAEANPKKILNPFKEWWPQAEATVGFYNAFQISGDRAFLEASERTWRFIETQLVDRAHGEWFHGVLENGKKSGRAKVSFWKCPYHNGRACLELLARMKTTEPPNRANR